MNKKPLVSVIVPTYNRRNMLPIAIESVLSQTYEKVECIVVNDCGEDVEDIVKGYNDPRLKYIKHDVNKGLGAARNTGIRASSGKYIAYLDDDDKYWNLNIEILVDKMLSTNSQFVYANALCTILQRDEERQAYYVAAKQLVYDVDYDSDLILVQNITPVTPILHEKALLDKVGYFDETLNVYEDYDLLIRISRITNLTHLRICTCEYTFRNDGQTMSSSRDFTTPLLSIFPKYIHTAKDVNRVKHAQNQILIARGKEPIWEIA